MWKQVRFKGLDLDVKGEFIEAEPEVGILKGFDIETVEYQGCDVTDLIIAVDADVEIEGEILFDEGF